MTVKIIHTVEQFIGESERELRYTQMERLGKGKHKKGLQQTQAYEWPDKGKMENGFEPLTMSQKLL